MQLVYFVTFAVLMGGVLAHPVEEDPAPATTLDDVADLGGQEAKGGERPPRWLSGGWGGGWNTGWNGGWGGGWNGRWSVSYRPWSSSYSSYWW